MSFKISMHHYSDTREKLWMGQIPAEGFGASGAHQSPPVSMRSKPTQSPSQQENSFSWPLKRLCWECCSQLPAIVGETFGDKETGNTPHSRV